MSRGELAPPIHRKRSESVKAAKLIREGEGISKSTEGKIPLITTGVARPPRSLQKIEPEVVKEDTITSPRKGQLKKANKDSSMVMNQTGHMLPVS